MPVPNRVNRVRYFSIFNLHNILKMEFQIRRENDISIWRDGQKIQDNSI